MNSILFFVLPFTFIIFSVYVTCAVASVNRAPFDLAEAESELVAGFHTEYSGLRWSFFFMAEYGSMFLVSGLAAVLFLGGWSINPVGGVIPTSWNWDLPLIGGLGLVLLQMAIMIGKTTLVVAFTMAIRWTLPRFRFDQLMKLAWQGMIPVAILLLAAAAIMTYFGVSQYMFLASGGCLFIIWTAHPFMPHQDSPNRRIPIIGSRFSPLSDEQVVTASTHPLALDDSAIPDPRRGTMSIL